jgi:hypothetical protein
MPVYAVFSRANWLLFYTGLTSLAPRMCNNLDETWVHVEIAVDVPCDGKDCAYCKKSETSPNVQQPFHRLFFFSSSRHGIMFIVDPIYGSCNKRLFVELNGISGERALEFFRPFVGKWFNYAGSLYNFRTWRTESSHTIGVHNVAEIAQAKSFFCSELAASFIITFYPQLQGQLVPCTTSPCHLMDIIVEQLKPKRFRLAKPHTPSQPKWLLEQLNQHQIDEIEHRVYEK